MPRGASILQDKRDPLRLGYVRVASRSRRQPVLFKRIPATSLAYHQPKRECLLLGASASSLDPIPAIDVGTTTLRKKHAMFSS